MVQQANPWWKSLPGASRRSCEDEEEQRRAKTFQVVPGGSGVLLGKRAGLHSWVTLLRLANMVQSSLEGAY